VFIAPLDILLSDSNVLEPDVFFVADSQSEIIDEPNIEGVPTLVIEVLSEPRIDRVRKRDIYARFGVPEYWIVDPDADRVEVYRLRDGGYGKPEIFEPGEQLVYPLLEGFVLDLSQLFAR
jgi:Uma2 family endonuclease